ncbi:putative D,D-dipeptide-binding periplasmic protein DdpA [archaeon HR01]|nr:putative D,D-dipeptide-binding periplasmic protein DdpA [archaeon HR01]
MSKRRGIGRVTLALAIVLVLVIAGFSYALFSFSQQAPSPTIVQTQTIVTTISQIPTTIVQTVTTPQITTMVQTVVTTPGPQVKNPNTLVIATIGDVESLDPAWAYDTASAEAIFNVYEPLIFFKIDPSLPAEKRGLTGEFEPRLATEWVWDDPRTVRFKIRENVVFHCGDTLTPEDVEYSFERAMVQDRDGGPVWLLLEPLLGVSSTRDDEGNIAVSFDDIDKAVEVDGQWVVFHLAHEFPPTAFLQIIAQSWGSIVSKEWAIEQGDWPGTAETWQQYNNPETPPLQNKMCGTGPFKLESWEPGVQYVLVRNDNYWRPPAKLERVIVKVVDEWTTRKFMLLSGDADMVVVPRQFVPELEGTACEGLTSTCPTGIRFVKDLPSLSVDAFFFTLDISTDSEYIGSGQLDGNGIPPNFFEDPDLRKAFAYAFDYETYIKDAWLGEAIRPCSPIVQGLAFFDPQAKCYTFNLDLAREHFQKAWNGQVWEKGFQLVLLYNTGNVARQTAAEIIKKNVESINPKFKIEVRNVDWPVFLRSMIQRKLPIFFIGWLADYPDPHNFYQPFFHSSGTFAQWQGYSNPQVDELIETAAKSTDPAERQRIYRQLDSIYYEEAISIPIDQPSGRHYERDWVQGWHYNPIYPGTYFYTIWKGY